MAGSPVFAAPVTHPDFTGAWQGRGDQFLPVDDDGKFPPLNAKARAAFDARWAIMQTGQKVPDSVAACLLHGVPRIMYSGSLMQIVQHPGVMAMLFEVYHQFRLIYFSGEPPKDPDPAYMGYSYAHWEGQTLRIDTTGLSEDAMVDRLGLPEGPQTHITERLRLLDGGKRMENKITIEDPTLYTAAWSHTVVYNKVDFHVGEYVCDNNRGVGDSSIPK
jgi:hypothetical protein